ncbi:MAG: Chromate resistance protein ChrB [Gemmatimonadota bacterium]
MSLTWLLCSYRLPRSPSRLRLAVWRRLRGLRAVMLHDGLWTLPADPKTREDFEWLAEEVMERGGTVLLWEAKSLGRKQDQLLIDQFRVEADERYAGLAEGADQLAKLTQKKRSAAKSWDQVLTRLRALERAVRLERRRDYFKAPGRAGAEAAIKSGFDLVRARTGEPQQERRRRVMGD